MSRRALLAVTAAATLALAALLAVLAASVFAVRDDVRAATHRLESGRAASAPSGHDVAYRIGRDLLAAGDDERSLDALERFRLRPPAGTPDRSLAARGRLEAQLARLAAGSGTRASRSQAANLSGVLLVEDAAADRTRAPRLLELGLEAFRQAVTLDPENGDAKFNLELLVRVLAAAPAGTPTGSGGTGATGAGAGAVGSGY